MGCGTRRILKLGRRIRLWRGTRALAFSTRYGRRAPMRWPVSTSVLERCGLDRRQRAEDDVADDLEAARADGVERVLRRVPRLVIEVDDVHRRNAGREKRQVVVSMRVESGMK